MTPTLMGRLQTRIVLVVLVALPITLVLVPLLGMPLVGALLAALIMGALGLVWELVYHALQQVRWDKDWPTLFALLVGVPEGLVLWAVLGPLGIRASAGVFAVHVGLIWLAGWLAQQGPMKVVAPAWRFHGARLIERKPVPSLLPDSPLNDMFLPEPAATPPAPAPEPAAAPEHEPVAAMDATPEPSEPHTPAWKRGAAVVGAGAAASAAWIAAHRPHPPARRPKAADVRPTRRHSDRDRRRPVLGRGARWAVLATAAVALAGLAVGLNLNRDHGAPTAAVDQTGHSPERTVKPAPPRPEKRASAVKPPDPQSQQPVGWQVPSDHRAYKTWNKNARVVPYALTVPRLQLQQKLGSVGLSKSGTMQTPQKASEPAWYESAAAPGQVGPGVLVGATQGKGAVFSRIGELVKGDTVLVTRMDSTTIQFKVDKVQKVGFDKFPTQSVYGMTDDPELRLVGFSPAKGKAKGQNVIVYGSAVQLLQPKQKS